MFVESHEVKKRPNDPFQLCINELMAEIEQKMKTAPGKFNIRN